MTIRSVKDFKDNKEGYAYRSMSKWNPAFTKFSPFRYRKTMSLFFPTEIGKWQASNSERLCEKMLF